MINEDGQSGQERRVATVMFADISGFTALSEKLDPEEVTTVMNGAFVRLESVVFAHGGIVDEYLGDCVKAVFGFSPDTQNPQHHAVEAALELRETLYQYNRDAGLPLPLDIHVGLTTGPVTAMLVGDPAKPDFSVFGDTVRLAGRLEDVSDKGQIFVGPGTYAATCEDFEYEPRDPVLLRPYPTPFPVYELLGKRLNARVVRESERRQASVLFAELVGLDAVAEQYDEARLTTLLNDLLRRMAEAVKSYGGVVDKYLGEGIMALFGVPNAIERAPQQAVNCAIELRRSMAAYQVENSLPAPIDLHIGINSGLCIAGDIGGRVKRDFTVMGDTVNLAARLKEAAHAGDIYIGPETYRYVQNDFDHAATEPLRLKGKAQPIPAYRVLSERAQVHRRAEPAERRLFSPLVGRDTEVATINAATLKLDGGRGGLLSVIADAGIGKSRLLSETLGAHRDRGQVLLARSLSIGRTMSFHPFVDLFRHWCGASEETPGAQLAQMLETHTRELIGSRASEILPFVGRLMGVPPDEAATQRLAGIEGEALERLISKSVRDLLAAIAMQRPRILVFEDLQWGDRSSFRLLEELAPLTREVALLFLLVARPQASEATEALFSTLRQRFAPGYSEVHLTPLGPAHAETLTANLLGLKEIPTKLRGVVTGRSEGNPFYIEEVVRSLLDQGAIEFRDGHYHVTPQIDAVALPGTIHEVVMTRVDRLDESARQILRIASVIGRHFPQRVLSRIVPKEYRLDQNMTALVDRQLVEIALDEWSVPTADTSLGGELEYLFRHALAQEAVYQSILLRSRKDLHQQVAKAIEDSFVDDLAKHYAPIAHHYRLAEQWEPAEKYLVKAGVVAAQAAASSEALTLFSDALTLFNRLNGESGGDQRHRALIEKHIALALLNTGQLPQSIPHFDAASALLGDPASDNSLRSYLRVAGNFAALLAQLYLGGGNRHAPADVERELEWSEILFNRARAQITSDPTRLFLDNIIALRRFNQLELKHFDQACTIFASGAGMFYYSGLSFRIGKRILDVAKGMVREGNVRDEFPYRSMAFIADYLVGEWQRAAVVPLPIVTDALRTGQFWDVNTYIGLYCDMLLRQGRFDAAQQQLKQLQELHADYGFQFAGTNHDGMRALWLIEQRRLDEAIPAAEHYAEGRTEEPLQVLAFGTLAKALLLAGRVDDAERALQRAASVSRPREVPPWHQSAAAAAQLRLDLMRLRHDRKSKVAKRSARRALSVAKLVAVQRPEILRLAGESAWLGGRERRARQLWQQCSRQAQQLLAKPEQARLYATVAQHLEDSAAGLDGLSAAQCAARAKELFDELGIAADAPL